MIFITFTSALLLLSISAIHIYWAIGGLWPGKTKQELIDLVFGKGNQFPSPLTCLFVAIFLFLFSILPIAWILKNNLALDSKMIFGLRILITMISVIFFLRGVLAYFPIITKQWKPIFVYYTKRIYNPLCITISFLLQIQIL
ncbi:DUF3995 domain-containing protein [Leptospira sp. 2 VSF19]|uniref:DUF3995 domain-containing protein n=1 Tax=Leptospira soteropolitanensis TaxID=2950025 RepID=A0AAW5VKU4_9LEPT|nr:DUF3995 domain-containing protein [Leptospira soteropolitanensis]MCW7491948.1 DUF3995 domain-containing protein [Leptospira soteropolitanensis]MCW7499532.1 DUF3995 domain-containing protein [Leptospira soteropolitanensis]MCW7520877.1 DUF3995 domain-containing protein [Leptospira soteropolitanensis]MCW7525636.1 DUF3995 domain-containing protein [Leptospira soteropolitanensis]MCW7529502.1 DUF3995 domain-containing protein [Leptospira soteropolitanensis]